MYGRKDYMDFTTITACGECCIGCKKKEDGICQDCIESDGHCVEWEQSNGCPIHISVQENIMCNFVDCVKDFLVNG